MRRQVTITPNTRRISARSCVRAAAFLLLVAFALASSHGFFCVDACGDSLSKDSDNNDPACACACHGAVLLVERPRVVALSPAPDRPVSLERNTVLPGVFPPIDHPPEA